MKKLKIVVTNTPEEAKNKKQAGYIPIECAFGEVSVEYTEDLPFDHHGKFSQELPVCVQAFEAKKHKLLEPQTNFVTTRAPDADASLAIAILSDSIEIDDETLEELVDVVAQLESSPGFVIDVDNKVEQILLVWNHLLRQYRGSKDFDNHHYWEYSVDLWNTAYEHVQKQDNVVEEAIKNEMNRQIIAKASLDTAAFSYDRKVMFIASPVWGFDVWYAGRPEVQVIVAYVIRTGRITLSSRGLINLKQIYPILGPGWGGRETVGGSPPGKQFQEIEAFDVWRKIVSIVC